MARSIYKPKQVLTDDYEQQTAINRRTLHNHVLVSTVRGGTVNGSHQSTSSTSFAALFTARGFLTGHRLKGVFNTVDLGGAATKDVELLLLLDGVYYTIQQYFGVSGDTFVDVDLYNELRVLSSTFNLWDENLGKIIDVYFNARTSTGTIGLRLTDPFYITVE